MDSYVTISTWGNVVPLAHRAQTPGNSHCYFLKNRELKIFSLMKLCFFSSLFLSHQTYNPSCYGFSWFINWNHLSFLSLFHLQLASCRVWEVLGTGTGSDIKVVYFPFLLKVQPGCVIVNDTQTYCYFGEMLWYISIIEHFLNTCVISKNSRKQTNKKPTCLHKDLSIHVLQNHVFLFSGSFSLLLFNIYILKESS